MDFLSAVRQVVEAAILCADSVDLVAAFIMPVLRLLWLVGGLVVTSINAFFHTLAVTPTLFVTVGLLDCCGCFVASSGYWRKSGPSPKLC